MDCITRMPFTTNATQSTVNAIRKFMLTERRDVDRPRTGLAPIPWNEGEVEENKIEYFSAIYQIKHVCSPKQFISWNCDNLNDNVMIIDNLDKH